ncbi:Clp protease N-terminal domain-containing protein [Streptomyces sp. NPDC056291]|uniref:Clp protease N-terminal domain-containing protein n=1 Tax=Streptomyces sp. NPDC056291 TaxID=3345772 RepID=UPI0035DED4A9
MTEAGEAGELDDVQSRVPRQPPSGQDALRPDDDARLSVELAAAVAGARRRAVRDGDRQIDTAHLLHTLLESDPEVRAVFDGGPQIARLLGYLVQRSIGYGLRWQSTVEDSGALPVVTEADGLSPMAFAALEYACERAARRGDDLARGLDLLAAIVVDPQARAVEVLTRAAIDAGELAARLDNDARGCPGKYAADGGPTY